MKKTKVKVLISSRSFGKSDPSPMEELKIRGYEIISNPYGRMLEEHELLELTKDVVGMIAGTEKITENVIKNASSLRVISRAGTGIDNINMVWAKKYGVSVFNTPDALTQAVTELTLALILSLYRRIVEADKNIRIGKWKPMMGSLLSSKTIGIVGLGRIGKRFALLVKPFELNIVAAEPAPDYNFASRQGIQLKSLKEVLKESDIITLHVPLSEETYHMIGETEFALMKKSSIIINASRGGLIDEDALTEALKKGLIGGAAIDTFEKEPYKGPLKKLNSVILTPHIGSYAKEARVQMEMAAVENLIIGLKERGIE
jgi:D-3-phosphoglycerate dehydrogenase